MSSFIQSSPTLDSYWRGIVLFGRNVASYKFALAHSLLDLAAEGKTFVTLEDLAVPYSQYLLAHLAIANRQGTSPSSRFLQACRDFQSGAISQDQLLTTTTQLGFINVIDAFHNVNGAEIPTRFYIDERKTGDCIRLTDSLFTLRETFQSASLPHEVEARWRLVETAWQLNLNPSLLVVRYDPTGDTFFVNDEYRRIDVTSSIDALNGYQKGRCFYCFSEITVDRSNPFAGDVDHFFPYALLLHSSLPNNVNINGIWNLVLSCQECNRGVNGKFARVPHIRYLERLHTRNSYLIDSHHPLRETLIAQTGATEPERRSFLLHMDDFAIQSLIHRWQPQNELPSLF